MKWGDIKDRLAVAYIDFLGWLLGKVWKWAVQQQTAAQHGLDLRAEAKAESDRPVLSDETPDMMFPADMIERRRPTWTGYWDE